MLSVDICVVGGGPAGATVARQLVLLGHSVCLVEQDPQRRKQVGESLSPSIVPLLENLGLMVSVERAGFFRSCGARVKWKSQCVEEIPHHAGGYLIDRQRFDHLLVQQAEAAGVQLLLPADATFDGDLLADGSCVLATFRDGTFEQIRARFVVDSSGRRRVTGGSRTRLAPQTMAFYGHWSGVVLPEAGTIVEAAPWGWAWGALLPGGAFSAIAFVDPKANKVPDSKAGGDQFYQQLLAKLELFSGCAKAQIDGHVSVCDSSIYLSAELIANDYIKVGEAACTLDPLSSQGVQAAIRGALQAATVVHTILEKPERTQISRQFYCDRQRETAEQSVLTSSRMYAECEPYAEDAFWKRRSALALERTSQRHAIPKDCPSPSSESVVDLSADASLTEIPAIKGDYVTSIPALCHPLLERPVGFLGDVEIERLLENVSGPIRVCDLVEGWRHLVPLATRHQIFQWMWQQGILQDR